MPEKSAHRRAKKKVAGYGSKTEVSLPGNKRLDAITKKRRRATEVERNGSPKRLAVATLRLKKSGAPQRVLQDPQCNIGNVVQAMRKARTLSVVSCLEFEPMENALSNIG